MAQPVRRVPARYVNLLLDVLRASGTDVVRMLQTLNFPVERLQVRDGMLTSNEMDQLVHGMIQYTGRQDLGFELGRRIKMSSHDLLGYGLLCCSNLDEMLRMGARHYHLMLETWTMNYRRVPGQGTATFTPAVPIPPESMRFYLEVLAIALQNQIHVAFGPDIPSYDVYVSMAQPAHIHRYLALAPVRFHFEEGGMPGVRFVFGTDLLSIPLSLADPAVVKQIDERCEAMAQRPPLGETGWVEYVSMVLRESRGKSISLEELAHRLNVSARTIDRRLKQEGMGYRQLVDKVRFELASEMLNNGTISVTEIAQQLGFSDAANFRRAFKRVTGVAPGEARSHKPEIPH